MAQSVALKRMLWKTQLESANQNFLIFKGNQLCFENVGNSGKK
jgi:hypothetical protein